MLLNNICTLNNGHYGFSYKNLRVGGLCRKLPNRAPVRTMRRWAGQLKSAARTSAPSVKTALKTTAKVAGGAVTFYSAWRGCELAEEAAHKAAGGRLNFLKTNATLRSEELGSSAGAAPQTPTPPPPAVAGSDGSFKMHSPSEDYFLTLPSDLSNFTILYLYLAACLLALIYVVVSKNHNPSVKKAAEWFLAMTGVSVVSWVITKVITNYIVNLDEDAVLALQSSLEDSSNRFLVYSFIVCIVLLSGRRVMQIYKNYKKV